MIFRENSSAQYRAAKRPMGMLTSTENSLNQHVKIKHPFIWEQIEKATYNDNI